MRRTLVLFVVLAVGGAVPHSSSAQDRRAAPVEELDAGSLSSFVYSQTGAVTQCAQRTDAHAYVAQVDVLVRPGPPPSTLHHAAIAVTVRSRPRDPALDQCVRSAIRDALRDQPYAVGRSVRARHTFRIEGRPEPVIEAPTPYSEREVQSVLASSRYALQQCAAVAGVPEEITLRLTVRPDGRLVLTSADIPPGAGGSALSCLAQTVSRLSVRGRPARAVAVIHRLAVQNRAW